MSSTEIAPAGPLDVGRPAREAFAAEQRELIRRTIAPDAPEAEFDLFLEIAARYRLNPLGGELYLARMPGRNGGPPQFTVIVGKDGHLAIAQRHADFRGIEADVVRAFDQFSVRHGRDGLEVSHSYDLGLDDFMGDPAVDDEPRPAGSEDAEQRTLRKRGKIVGAWAKVHREGRVPAYFFAPWQEYAPRDISRNRAWRTTPSVMIRKCAVSNALREAYSLSGLYDEAELSRFTEAQDEAPLEPEWGEDPELAARLRALVAAANDATGGRYRTPKVRALLDGATHDERRAFADELERAILDAGGSVPAPPEAPGERAGDDAVEDAQVVA